MAIQRFQRKFSMLVVTRRHFQHLHFFTFYEKSPVLGVGFFRLKKKHLPLKNGWCNSFKHSFLHDQICGLETDTLWAPDIFQQKVLGETVGTRKKIIQRRGMNQQIKSVISWQLLKPQGSSPHVRHCFTISKVMFVSFSWPITSDFWPKKGWHLNYFQPGGLILKAHSQSHSECFS